MYKKSNDGLPFVAPAAFIDLPDTALDQMVDTTIYQPRWQSIQWVVYEVGKAGPLRFCIQASVDKNIWTDLFCSKALEPNPTQGESNVLDLNPGGVVYLEIDDPNNGHLLAYRFFRVQVMSPDPNPNKRGQAQVVTYAR